MGVQSGVACVRGLGSRQRWGVETEHRDRHTGIHNNKQTRTHPHTATHADTHKERDRELKPQKGRTKKTTHSVGSNHEGPRRDKPRCTQFGAPRMRSGNCGGCSADCKRCVPGVCTAACSACVHMCTMCTQRSPEREDAGAELRCATAERIAACAARVGCVRPTDPLPTPRGAWRGRRALTACLPYSSSVCCS